MVSSSARNSRFQTTQQGGAMSSQDGLGVLLECMRSAWETGQEDARDCTCRFLAGIEGAEQEEQLGRLLSFVEELRGQFVERLQGHGNRHGGDGTMEEASRKTGRRDAGNDEGDGQGEPEDRREAGAKDKTRSAFVSPSLGTAATASPPETTQEGMSPAVKDVLLNHDLLPGVWGFVLGGTGRQDLGVVGQLSLVCRNWREVGAWDAWWGRVEENVLPMLWEEVRGKAASSRGRMLQYGRFLEGERDPLEGQEEEGDWLQGLEGQVEIFDRMDGLQMLYMRGSVSFIQEYDQVAMEFGAKSSETQVKGAAFSAASRDPLRRFSTMEEYLERGHAEEYPCCLCIRVTVRDMRTGRMAVIWEDSEPEFDVIDCGDGRFRVYVAGGKRQENRFRWLLRTGSVWLDMNRVSDQGEGVNEQDVLYRIDPLGLEVKLWGMNDHGDGYLNLEQFGGILRAVLG